MKIHFRDVQTGIVEARAVIEIAEGVFLNEVTILNIEHKIVVEFPKKNFKGKDHRTHHLDIITFENDDKRILWELQIKNEYTQWRKANKKVLVYEDTTAKKEEKTRAFAYKDKPRRGSDRGGRKTPRTYHRKKEKS